MIVLTNKLIKEKWDNKIILLIKLINLWLGVYVKDPDPLVCYTMLTVFIVH